MPVSYTTNKKASNDYIIMVHGEMLGVDDIGNDDDPIYEEAMDSVLQSILKRLPKGSLARQYNIVCNVEARPDFGGDIEEDADGNEVELKGRYRVRNDGGGNL